MKIRSIVALTGTLAAASACDAFQEAFTAHVDVVARVNDRELSVTRLSDLLGKSTLQIPVNRETAGIVADLWTGYHLLAAAAARGDSVIAPKLIDEATQGITESMRLRRYMDSVSRTFTREPASEATYTQATGGLFVARHILFSFPGGATQEQRDSVRRRAQSVRGQVTPANFAELARRNSADSGSRERGGDLGVFRRGDMVKPFGDAVAALKPGDISPPVETQFGYHIIQRSTYSNARSQYDAQFNESVGQRAESVFMANADADAQISVRSGAPAAVKAAAMDFAKHRRDTDVLATFKGGSLTVGRLVSWVEMMPPQARIAQQIRQSHDTLVRQFVRSIARNEVLLKKADSAGITVSEDERRELRTEFKRAIQSLWQQVGLDPAALAEGGRSVPERERMAADHVEALMDRVLAGEAQAVQVPVPAQAVLALLYTSKTMPAGLDRAVERASKVRASADSTRLAAQSASQVPLPGAGAAPPATSPPVASPPAKSPPAAASGKRP